MAGQLRSVTRTHRLINRPELIIGPVCLAVPGFLVLVRTNIRLKGTLGSMIVIPYHR